jgi:anti-sigma factor RsiW
MAQMDHSEAKQLQAAEKYLLGELSLSQREEYEEHCFDCADCALDLKSLAAFADNAREVLRQEKASSAVRGTVPVSAGFPSLSGWFRWLQPVLVPACAILLLLAGYQNLVSIPHWKGLAAQSAQAPTQATPTLTNAAAPHVLPIFSLLGANRRGDGRPVVHAKGGESFALKVDITDADPSSSSSYVLRLDDASGAAHVLGTVSPEEARNSVFVEVPAGFPAGNARLVVLGKPQPGAQSQTDREIASLPFVVEFGPDSEHHQ